ncbi:hypothetical protein IRY61_03340 [Candidatus Saccharibacteria bacterium]|jgi:Fimbrial assembly protein (PilN).|nr:hypothetical protein [Candidatus Saccharibacteria bacterium]
MINLLPPDLKTEYRYARKNSQLLRVIAVFFFGFVSMAVIAAIGVLYINQAANSYASEAASLKESLKQQKQDEVNAEAQDISNSLKLAVQVLSQQILFSKLLEELAPTIPKDVVLTDIAISELQGALDISAKAVDYTAATQLQVNLSDPNNKIFSKADIVGIGCTSSNETTDERYPCIVNIRAQFGNSKRFLFITDDDESGQEANR